MCGAGGGEFAEMRLPGLMLMLLEKGRLCRLACGPSLRSAAPPAGGRSPLLANRAPCWWQRCKPKLQTRDGEAKGEHPAVAAGPRRARRGGPGRHVRGRRGQAPRPVRGPRRRQDRLRPRGAPPPGAPPPPGTRWSTAGLLPGRSRSRMDPGNCGGLVGFKVVRCPSQSGWSRLAAPRRHTHTRGSPMVPTVPSLKLPGAWSTACWSPSAAEVTTAHRSRPSRARAGRAPLPDRPSPSPTSPSRTPARRPPGVGPPPPSVHPHGGGSRDFSGSGARRGHPGTS